MSEIQSKKNGDRKPVTVEEFTFVYQHGFSQTPAEASKNKAHHLEVESRVTKALCYAIGSGGVYTDHQARWIKGYIMTKGAPQEVVDSVDSLLLEGADLMDLELMTSASGLNDLHLLKEAGPVMIYDMYRCAALEDYPVEQVTAICMIAEELGVRGPGELEEIKNLVEQERILFKKRIQVLYKGGHPLLDKKYEKWMTNDVDV